ncbi:MAG: hypothetical protein ACRD2W_17925 [Acidimicrobiales bacterium]
MFNKALAAIALASALPPPSPSPPPSPDLRPRPTRRARRRVRHDDRPGCVEVVAVGSSSETQPELNSVRIQIQVTICVRVFGTTYCGTVTVTIDL